MARDSCNLPSADSKPSLLEWLETYLPFRLPRIPLPQTAKNLDKAASSIVLAGTSNAVARIRASTTRIDAMSSAEKSFIKLGQDQITNYSDGIAGRALQYALGDAIQKQTNREEILRIASEQLASDIISADAAEEMDDDWLNSFRDFAETKSNVDMQQFWAKILSTEIRTPGTTSLRTLNFLSTVSTDEAKLIVELFSFVIDGVYVPQWATYQKYFSYDNLITIEQIGVVSGSFGVAASNKSAEKVGTRRAKATTYVIYYDKAGIIDTDDETFNLSFETAVLTEVGRTLFDITDSKVPNYGYFEDFLVQLGEPPIVQISIADIVGREQDGIVTDEERVIYSATDEKHLGSFP